jgi:hypothetical protein
MRRLSVFLFLGLVSLVSVHSPCPGQVFGGHDKKVPQHHYADDPIPSLTKAVPELAKLQASDDQDPLPTILLNAGRTVGAFSQAFTDVTAREEVTQEQLFSDGSVREKQRSAFSYLVLNRARGSTWPFEEYRTDLQGHADSRVAIRRGYAITSGFTTICLHFETDNQKSSKFRYLGQDVVDGIGAYVVAFAQQPGTTGITERIWDGSLMEAVLVQGIAWIGKDNFQILRIRTDLLEPLVKVGVTTQSTDVRFSEFRLEGIPSPLWLPETVTVNLATVNHNHLRNLHRYSNYRRFRVEAVIKPGPK